MSKELTPDNLTESTRKVVQTYIDNPTKTHAELGEMLGVSRGRVSQILSSPRVTAIYPLIARRTIRSKMLPIALKRYEQIIATSSNDAVAEKAAGRVLQSEGALGDARVDVNVKAEITLRDVRELQEIVKKAADYTQNAIDTEVIPE